MDAHLSGPSDAAVTVAVPTQVVPPGCRPGEVIYMDIREAGRAGRLSRFVPAAGRLRLESHETMVEQALIDVISELFLLLLDRLSGSLVRGH